jgi:hypothetical protein
VLDEIAAVAGAVKNAGMHLVVKLHPVTDPKPFIQAFRSHDGIHVLSQADLPKLILGCVATLGHTSSTLMFPIVCDRPLLIITFSHDVEQLGYYLRQGVGKGVASAQELTDELLRIQRRNSRMQTERNRFIADFVTYCDGRSHDRIASELLLLFD